MFDHIEAFYRPSSVREAVRLLHKGPGKGLFVAGATDVGVQCDRSTRFLIDVTRLGLSYIRKDGAEWLIGATTSMADLENSTEIRGLANGILAQAASLCGSVQNRNMATVGGNLANASPAADTATPLMALDAAVVVAGKRGQRRIALSEFFAAPHKTVLNGSLIVEVALPVPSRSGRAGWSFQKLGRSESDISLVNVAAGIHTDARGVVKSARIALGGVAPTPLRAMKAEQQMLGQKLDEASIDKASAGVTLEVDPITDIRSSAAYRREMSRVLTRRALRECAQRAGCAL